MSTLLCLDIGSTWTKGALVAADGTLLGTAQHPTTPPEVLTGIASVTTRLEAQGAPVLACSSAGGGLRLAVVGQERLVSAEAGYRVALSAGAKIVHVVAGQLDGAAIRELRATEPDLVLLAGGTDGGDRSVLLHNARRIAANRLRPPIVLAGNADARAEAEALLHATGRTVVATDNVLPDVGELAPGPARAAIRELFLRHVIGGKGLSKGNTFRSLVRAVTPDAVLIGVSRLAAILAKREAGAVMVVDVGGATTDVYSAVSTVDENVMERTVALPADRRTVEGDLGMRWSAPGIVAEAEVERLEPQGDLQEEARRRAAAVDWIPGDDHGRDVDAALAALAAILATRRHLRLVDGQLGPKGAGLLVLSGGVFRHATPERLQAIEDRLRADPVLRPVLRNAEIIVDGRYVLAPAGLLADAGHVATADALLENHFSA
ncbi:glutamate mutase L [Kutzneria sp. CA-103260]|uniref:glutamate mutase L n=1 Tax=Kutzneria sp. CA-103260 TaxID=2802641 RepID=UPI001BA97FB4|nr:glutamate mutase L [Kutzneria sp. CA-103260]QUQ70952.1 MutL protein [Kutzneria sp. CA-103260]